MNISPTLIGLIKLTRWKEHVPYTIPLTLAGSLMAISANDLSLDWKALAMIVANIVAMSFAFIINDVADAPDDSLDKKKKAHNMISSGIISAKIGYLVAALTALISLGLFALGGWWAFVSGALTVLLCHVYSAYPFRLKAKPVTDVLSHAFMLSGLLVMTGYFAYDTQPGLAWFVIASTTFFSAYGQFYQQIIDVVVDTKAGLKNTVVVLGQVRTRFLMRLAALCGIGSLVIAIVAGVFPWWLGIVGLGSGAVLALFPWNTDMRGYTGSRSGRLHKPVLIVLNLMMAAWAMAHVPALAFLGM